MAKQDYEEEDNTTLTELSEAWDEHEAAEPVEEIETVDEVVESAPIEGDAPEEPEEKPAEEPEPDVAAEVEETAEAVADEAAPVGLSAEAREVWKDTPKAMKDAVAKREKDFANGIQQYAEKAKRADNMERALSPYQQYLSMNGGPQHIETMLQTGQMLQMGSPVQKAQMAAQLIQQYGVDINTLDSLLVGNQPPPEAQQSSQLQELLQQELAPYKQFMQTQQEAQQQQFQQEQGRVVSDVEKFATNPINEFYNDVKMDMADLMDMAANRGQEMSMQDAYDRACRMNTGISNILDSRRSATEISKKVSAAASIHGSPGGPGGSAVSTDRRSVLESAWENTGRT